MRTLIPDSLEVMKTEQFLALKASNRPLAYLQADHTLVVHFKYKFLIKLYGHRL